MQTHLIRNRLWLTVILITGIFLLDVETPLGWSIWLLYVLPLLFAYHFTGGKFLYVISAACTALMTVTYLYDAPQAIPSEIALFNRALGAGVLWMTAFLLVQSAKGEETSAKLAAIVESSTDAILSKTLDGIVLSVNKAAERMFGYAAKDILGKCSSFLLPPDRPNEENQIVERIRQGESMEHFETVRRRKDGQHLHVSLTLSPIRDAEGTIVGVSKIARDITQRKRAEEENAWLFAQVEESRERLRALSRRLLQVQEEERRSLACELHDEIGQALTAIKINLQTAQRLTDRTRIIARLDDCFSLVESMLQRVRALSLDLRPPLLDELGLAPALRWYVSAQAARAGLSVNLDIDPLNARFPPDREIACFRVVQEALTNVIRHAQASHVSVTVQARNGRLDLSIRDDGRGFDVQSAVKGDPSRSHVGLLGMHERVRILRGQITINSVPMRGTEIQASIPLQSVEALRPSPAIGVPS